MAADPTIIVEPIVIGLSVLVPLLLLLGLHLARPSDPAALTRHWRVSLGIGVALAAWFAVDYGLARAGIFDQNHPLVPNIAFGFSLPLIAGLVFIVRSQRLNEVLARVPQAWIIGVQLYRAVGAIFLYLYAFNLLPGAFALPAGIGDVAVGLTAPFVAYAVARGYANARGLAIAWNIAGIADLVVAVGTGFLTSPPFRLLPSDVPDTLITAYPLVMIPLFAVPLSILLHVVSLRRFLADKPVGRVAVG